MEKWEVQKVGATEVEAEVVVKAVEAKVGVKEAATAAAETEEGKAGGWRWCRWEEKEAVI